MGTRNQAWNCQIEHRPLLQVFFQRYQSVKGLQIPCVYLSLQPYLLYSARNSIIRISCLQRAGFILNPVAIEECPTETTWYTLFIV